MLQAGARAERRPIAAKGLTGPGYDGHAFWDTEMFVLPVLTYTHPAAVRDALHWRHAHPGRRARAGPDARPGGRGLPVAHHRGAGVLGVLAGRHRGLPHRRRTSPTRCVRYVQVTGDTEFEREIGLELLVETARLWRSLGHHDRHGQFHIDGVTGPDEYTAVKNDNVYTNLMAQRNLRRRRRRGRALPGRGVPPRRRPTRRRRPGGTRPPPCTSRTTRSSASTSRSRASPGYQEWDFAHTPPEKYPLLLHYPYFDLYRKQVVKQADLVLAMHWRGDAFTPEEKLRNFVYYERRTVRDSSLSACTQAVLAAEVGHPELAHDYLREAALMDLHDLQREHPRRGAHGLARRGVDRPGRRVRRAARPRRQPVLRAPAVRAGSSGWSSRSSGAGCGCGSTSGRTRPRTRCATATRDDMLELRHHGELVRVTCGKPVTMPIPAAEVSGPVPEQAPGRAPLLRLPENEP